MKKKIFLASLKSKKEEEVDPEPDPDPLVRGTDPHQNVTDPQHWTEVRRTGSAPLEVR
jgi:hypothetical protein